jgi:hypothetical protein
MRRFEAAWEEVKKWFEVVVNDKVRAYMTVAYA